MCLTSEMRTCFLGIPDIKKFYSNGDITNPELQIHKPPCQDSEDPDEYDSPIKKSKTKFNQKQAKDHCYIYQSIFKQQEDTSELVDLSAQKKYLFKNIDVIDDISLG